jgi:hypothetical protein
MLGRQKRGQDQDLARAAGWTIPCRDRSPEAERSGVFTRTRQGIRLPEAWRLRQLVEVVKRNFRDYLMDGDYPKGSLDRLEAVLDPVARPSSSFTSWAK